MIYFHGGYDFPAGSVGVLSDSKIRIRSPRNHAYLMRRTMVLEGELKGTSQADIRQKLEYMSQFFQIDGNNSGLYHDDGSPSVHLLTNVGSLSGVRLLQAPSFNRSDPAEYTTYRSFTFTVQADYPILFADTIFDWSETVRYRGNCGPRKQQIELDTGAPDEQIVSQQTVQYIIQSGRAVGTIGYPDPPDPLYSELLQDPDEGKGFDDPIPQGSGFTLYPRRWQYIMASNIPRDGRPVPKSIVPPVF